MANRYWVGGTGSWDATAGTKWATTSGGAGGSAVPTSSDDVFFDANSSGTITLTVQPSIKSLNCTGFTGTLTTTPRLLAYVYGGNITFVSGMTLTNFGLYFFQSGGTQTITMGGKSLENLVIDGNCVLTMADALTVANFSLIYGSISLKAGTTNTLTSVSSSDSATGYKTLKSDSAGNVATVTAPTTSTAIFDYTTIQDIAISGDSSWMAGPNSTDNGNNTGWTFAPSTTLPSILLMENF